MCNFKQNCCSEHRGLTTKIYNANLSGRTGELEFPVGFTIEFGAARLGHYTRLQSNNTILMQCCFCDNEVHFNIDTYKYVKQKCCPGTAVKIQMTVAANQFGASECRGHAHEYSFMEGTSLEFVINSDTKMKAVQGLFSDSFNRTRYIEYKREEKYFKKDINVFSLPALSLNETHSGLWEFRIFNHIDQPIPVIEHTKYGNLTVTTCTFKIVVLKSPSFHNYLYIGGGVFITVVLLQTGIIMYYKSKAKAARTHPNWSVSYKTNDEARYQDVDPRKSTNRDSGLYETLEEMSLQRIVPPLPPGLDTLPKNADRAVQSAQSTLDRHGMLSTAHSSSSTQLIPEAGHKDTISRIKNRPPIPLPVEYEEFDQEETYEPPPDLQIEEENTYEDPPEVRINKGSGNPAAPKKPDKIGCRTKGLNSGKPPVMVPSNEKKNTVIKPPPKKSLPKPAAKKIETNAVAAELLNVLQRRNAAQSILNHHETLSRTPEIVNNGPPTKASKSRAKSPSIETEHKDKKSLFKKPMLPPVASRPKPTASEVQGLPVPRLIPPPTSKKALRPVHPIQEATYNDIANSSDEDWTYEELPEIKLSNRAPRQNGTQEATYNDIANSSDEDWTYEELPEIKLSNRAPRQNGTQVLPARIPQSIPPAYPIEESTYNDVHTSDEEWTYEELPEIKLNKPVPRRK